MTIRLAASKGAPYRYKAPLTLAARADATRRTIDVWRDRAMDWRSRHHCLALMHAQARAMGHRMPAQPVVRTPMGGRRELGRRGFASVEALLDSLFVRIVPAMMRVGDLCTLPGEPGAGGEAGLAAMLIADGQGNLFGWHGSDLSRLSTIKFAMADCTGAWRLGE